MNIKQAKSTNRYIQLIKNTFIFGIGTFSQKFLVFLLMPLYTHFMTTAEYGTADLFTNTCNLLGPLVGVGIVQSIVRFALDKEEDKAKVFSSSVVIFLIGYIAFVLISPLAKFIPSSVPFPKDYLTLLVVFVFTSSFSSVCSEFIRGLQKVKLYAINGVISTITIILFTILFLIHFNMGVNGYILAIVCSDALSIVFMFITAKLWRYITFSTGIKRRMLAYAVPMIPTTIFWWVTQVSDRYLVTGMLGDAANGLYAVSNKIPTVMVLVSTIFIYAWQISSVTEDEDKRRSFFSNVFEAYSSLLFVVSSIVIIFCRPVLDILVDSNFYDAWHYIPVLVLATTFSCFVSFFGTIYMLYKKSTHAMWTTLAGAALNVVLNLFLIPWIGIQGSAIATFASYFIIFIIRAIDERSFLNFHWSKVKTLACSLLIIAQAVLMVKEIHGWIIYSGIIILLLFVINGRVLKNSFLQLKS